MAPSRPQKPKLGFFDRMWSYLGYGKEEKQSLATMPDELEDKIFGFLDARDKQAFASTNKASHTLFQQEASSAALAKHVAYGEQKEAEQLIQQILQRRGPKDLLALLQKKSKLTDCSGRCFKEPELTPFQYAFWAKDQQMLEMLEKYLSEEEQAQQLIELRDNRVKYEPVLMTIDVEEKYEDEDEVENKGEEKRDTRAAEQKLDVEALRLREISSQNGNKPILIKRGKAIYLYGYDFSTTAWTLTSLDPKVFQDKHNKDLLAFPQNYPLAGLYVKTDLNDLPEIGNYVLLQAAPGSPPSALYFIGENGAQPIDFPLNQNLASFTRTLYPRVRNATYSDIPQLSPEQLQALTRTTNHPLLVPAPGTLTPEMYAELAKGHSQGTEYGMHYDFSRLQIALRTYRENCAAWTGEQCTLYANQMIGGAQDVSPGHLRDEYCFLERPFSPTPSFNEPIPRGGRWGYQGYDFGGREHKGNPWYSREGSGLSNGAIFRCGGREANLHGDIGEHWGRGHMWATDDLEAVTHLGEVRTAYVAQLTRKRLNPAPVLVP